MKRLGIIFLMLSILIYGNPVDEANKLFNREEQKIEQERKWKEQQEKQKELENSKFLNGNTQIKEEKTIENDVNNHKFFIEKINLIDKENLLTQNEEYEILRDYTYKEISSTQITELLSKITNKLISKGYITSVATINENSNLEKGILELEIVPGKIEKVEINSGNALDKYKEFFMFKRNEGKVLNIRDLDQVTDNFNSLNSNNMTMEIIPGEEKNKSVIKVSNEIKNKYMLSLVSNNHGEDNQNGIWRGGVSLNIDSPLGIGDNIYFTYTTVKDKKPDRSWKISPNQLQPGQILPIGPVGYDPKKDGALPYKRRLDMFNIGYTAKFRDYTLKLNSSKTIRESSFYAFNTIYDMKSSNSSLSAVLDKVIYRSQKSKVSVDVGINRKHNDNYLELAELTNRKLAIGSIHLNGSTSIYKGLLGVTLGYEKGLRIFHAERSSQAQSEKVTLDLSYYKPITQKLIYRMNVNGSYSEDVLYGSEKQTIGGVGSVGGFHTSTVQGDKGIEIGSEISYQIPVKIGTLTPYAGYSYGVVKNNKDNTKYAIGYMTGITTGLRFNSKYLDFNFGYALPQTHSEYIKPRKQEYYFSGAIKFVF